MTNTTNAGATPANVAQSATQPGVLALNEVSLIGLFGRSGDLSALVRLPGGKIREVKPGANLAMGKVVGIDEHGLMWQKNGRTKRITLPGS